MKYINNIKGYTLLEILVVFLVIALILTIVPPFLPNVVANTQVKSATRELIANLRKTRSLAISRQQEMVLKLDTKQNAYSIDENEKVLSLPESSSLSIITAKPEQLTDHIGGIRFFPDGSSTGGQIILANEQQKYFIDINWLTGKIKIHP